MDGNGLFTSPFDGLRGLCRAEIWTMEGAKIRERPSRMEAIYYASEGYKAAQDLFASGFEIISVGDLAKVIWHGIQTRVFVQDQDQPFKGVSKWFISKR